MKPVLAILSMNSAFFVCCVSNNYINKIKDYWTWLQFPRQHQSFYRSYFCCKWSLFDTLCLIILLSLEMNSAQASKSTIAPYIVRDRAASFHSGFYAVIVHIYMLHLIAFYIPFRHNIVWHINYYLLNRRTMKSTYIFNAN